MRNAILYQAKVQGPESIAGLVSRHRASSLASVTADGARVSSWADDAGAFPLAQATGSAQPLLCAQGGPDEGAFACFDSSNRGMSNASIPWDRRNTTVMWVGDINTLDTSGWLFYFSGNACILLHLNGVLQVFNGGSNVNLTFRCPSGRRIAIVVTFGATGIRVYVDTAASPQTVTAASASSGTGVFLNNTSNPLLSRVYEFAVFNRELSASEVGTLMRYASLVHGTGSMANTPVGRVVFDGDSLTQGIGATRNRNWTTYLGVSRAWQTHNFGISGQTLTSMSGDIGDLSPFANSANWLFVWGGTNDLLAAASGATVEGRLNTYCTAAISAGFPKSQIVVFTYTVSTVTTARDDANTLIRSNYTNYAGAMIDVAVDPNLGVNVGGGFKNSAFYADQTHMNDTGYGLLAALVRATVPLPF